MSTGLPTEPAAPPVAAALPPPSRRGAFSWMLFDWAAQPVNTLVTTFVFPPFFVNVIAADSTTGQAIWGWAAAAAGIAVAVLSPVFGAIADAAGRRKPWIAAFSVLLVAGALLLWFTEPGSPAAIAAALIGFGLATLGDEFATVFTNAMMPSLTSEQRLGRLSGSGWALGYLGGMLALVVMLALFVADTDTGETFFGLTPLFGLDPATYEGVRAVGPLTAIWYIVFALPLFLFVPDAPRLMRIGAAVRSGWGALGQTLAGLRHHPNILRYLIARMIYADGLAGLFAFGGVYASSIFGWGTTETLLFGVIVIIAAVPGAWLGGRLDDRRGSKPVILISLVVLIVASLGALSVDASHILFMVPVDPPTEGDGLFAAPGERLYLGFGAAIGAVAGPLQAASRTLLVRLAPRDSLTQFFGLYALSGRLTTFLASGAVALLTTASDSQRIGISVLVLFFVVGAVLMRRVHGTPDAGVADRL